MAQICHLCVPQKTFRKGISIRNIPGISGLKRKRKKIKSRLPALVELNPSSFRIPHLKSSLVNVNSAIKSKFFLSKQAEEEQAIAAIKKNPSFFYSYAKKFSKVRRKIGPLKSSDGQYVSDSEGMANLLQKQFCSVFSDPDSDQKEDPNFPPAECCLDDFNFTIEDILLAIDSMRLNAAPGEDEFPVILLKRCKASISIPLYILWKSSLETGKIHLTSFLK